MFFGDFFATFLPTLDLPTPRRLAGGRKAERKKEREAKGEKRKEVKNMWL